MHWRPLACKKKKKILVSLEQAPLDFSVKYSKIWNHRHYHHHYYPPSPTTTKKEFKKRKMNKNKNKQKRGSLCWIFRFWCLKLSKSVEHSRTQQRALNGPTSLYLTNYTWPGSDEILLAPLNFCKCFDVAWPWSAVKVTKNSMDRERNEYHYAAKCYINYT